VLLGLGRLAEALQLDQRAVAATLKHVMRSAAHAPQAP
jgi:hypothetical protein